MGGGLDGYVRFVAAPTVVLAAFEADEPILSRCLHLKMGLNNNFDPMKSSIAEVLAGAGLVIGSEHSWIDGDTRWH